MSEQSSNSGLNGELRTLCLDNEDTDKVLESLSSDTARAILMILHEKPATASEVSERVDVSLPTTRYHLGNLEEAELIRVAETCFSKKGRKMKVYAPTEEPLIMIVGRQERKQRLMDSLRQLLSG